MIPKIKSILKNQPFFYTILSWVYHFYITFLFNFFRIFPIKSNKIIFCSYFGNDYSDNSKYIVEELIKQNIDCDIVWQLKQNLLKKNHLPSNIRFVKHGSIMEIYEMVTAKIWVDNSRKTWLYRKRKNQYYIQTWHGAPALKKIEMDAEQVLPDSYIYSSKLDSQKANLFLSNCRFISDLYKRSFWYDGEILECGSPRNDIFFKDNTNIRQKVYEFYKIPPSNKIALYAPTFRRDENLEVYNIDYSLCLESLHNKFGGKWVLLLRLHPLIANKTSDMKNCNAIIKASDYPDTQELLAVAELLLTDYSSIMFDYSLRKKPCFLYIPDKNAYSEDRGYYFKFEELPFAQAKNNKELNEIISNFDYKSYINTLNQFQNRIEYYETGVASYSVVEKIKGIIK